MSQIARAEGPDAVAGTVDPIWTGLRQEAEAVIREEPAMTGFVVTTILNHATLESAVAHRVASRLGHATISDDLIAQTYQEALEADPSLGEAFRADIAAVLDRDPAATRAIEPVLYFKGFHAIETHRLAHWLCQRGRQDFALYLQSRASEVFQVDINPQVRMGKGIFIDHGTGVVIGQTTIIEDNVSMLQEVTLGGTGKERGDRHPKIRRGVLIGAGAKILGNIEVGECARVAAGSVVLHPVPAKMTVAGVPARVVGAVTCAEPARAMDQVIREMEGI